MGAETEKCIKCQAPLRRGGKCPRLCEPIESPPVYTGETIIGRGCHIGNIVRAGSGWIG